MAGNISKRGFGSMDKARLREIASNGGRSQNKATNPGNFANNKDRAREAGRKGGRKPHQHINKSETTAVEAS